MASFASFEDSALIQHALAGETECFTALTNRHLPAVRRRIYTIAPKTVDPEDVVQEVLLKVWLHLSSFRAQSSFRTWMTRVALNEVLQVHRRARSRPVCHAFRDFNTFVSPHESPLDSLARREATQRVHKAVAGLPEKYRQILILRDFEELTEREVAQSLQQTVGAVKTRLRRGRRMLLNALKQPRLRIRA
jgi:RNA polymerase sigma-70 factor (ECF subfamily)